MLKAVNELVVVTGRKGCGKTSYAARAVQAMAAAGRRVIVVSPVQKFADEKGWPALPAGSAVVTSADQTAWEMLRGRSVLVLPEDETAALFAFRFAWAVAAPERPLVLVVDEIDLYLNKWQPDETLRKVCRYGRHRCLSLWGIAQRPANIHNDLLANADRVVVYQAKWPSDVRVLSQFTGLDESAIRNLNPFQCLEVDQNSA